MSILGADVKMRANLKFQKIWSRDVHSTDEIVRKSPNDNYIPYSWELEHR